MQKIQANDIDAVMIEIIQEEYLGRASGMGQTNKDISRAQSHAAMMQSYTAIKQTVETDEKDEKEEEAIKQHDPLRARRELPCHDHMRHPPMYS